MTKTNEISTTLDEGLGYAEDESRYGAELILALDRLFKVGPYYPPGHAACKRVTSDFKHVIKGFLGEEATLRFRMDGGELLLQDQPLDPGLAGAEDFQTLLGALGIDHLDIDEHATVDELLTFVSRFLAFRNEIAGVKKFQQMEFDGLPRTVRVAQRRFTTGIALIDPPGAPAAGAEAAGAPEGGAEAAEPAAADDRTGDALTAPEGATDEDEYARTANLDHSLNPNGNVVATPPKLAENKRPVAENLDHLIDRLESAGQTDIRSRALESVELMIKNLGRSGRNDDEHVDFLGTASQDSETRQQQAVQKKPSEKPAEPAKPVVYEFSRRELRSALAAYAGKAVAEYHAPEQDNSENLSIILLMLTTKQPRDVLRSISRKLDHYLTSRLQPAERTILVQGIRNLLAKSEPQVQAKNLPLVIRAFRNSRPESVIRFLSDVCGACDEEQRGSFWPFVVNELLRGDDGGDTPSFLHLCRLAGRIPHETMREHAPLLRRMDTVKRNRIDDDVILPPLPELFPVFSVLLEASHPGQVAVKLVQGLKYSTPEGVGGVVLPLITNYRHGYREFLVELLAPGQEDGPSDALLETAGKILTTDLLALVPKRRSERWVPDTIAALAELEFPGVEKILRTVKGRRFLFLFPTWPKECRRAAARALKQRELAALAAEATEEAARGNDTDQETEKRG